MSTAHSNDTPYFEFLAGVFVAMVDFTKTTNAQRKFLNMCVENQPATLEEVRKYVDHCLMTQMFEAANTMRTADGNQS